MVARALVTFVSIIMQLHFFIMKIICTLLVILITKKMYCKSGVVLTSLLLLISVGLVFYFNALILVGLWNVGIVAVVGEIINSKLLKKQFYYERYL